MICHYSKFSNTKRPSIIENLYSGSVKTDPYINNVWSPYFWIWKNIVYYARKFVKIFCSNKKNFFRTSEHEMFWTIFYFSYNITCVCIYTVPTISRFNIINIFLPPLFFYNGRLKSPLRLFHSTILFLFCQCLLENVMCL